MTQKESIRDIILHQKKHDFVKNVLLNEQEREKISTLPKESNDLVNHWTLFYRSNGMFVILELNKRRR